MRWLLLTVALTLALMGGAWAQDPRTPSADALLVEAHTLHDGLEFERAIEVLARALVLAPQDARAFYLRALCYLKSGQIIVGLLDLARALQLDPTIAEMVFPGLAEMGQVTDPAKVIAALDAEVARSPGDDRARLMRALYSTIALEKAGHGATLAEQARADLYMTIELVPDHVVARLLSARLGVRIAMASPADERAAPLAEAQVDAEWAVQRVPELALAHLLRAMVLSARSTQSDLGDVERDDLRSRAIDTLRRARKRRLADFVDVVVSEPALAPLHEEPGFAELIR